MALTFTIDGADAFARVEASTISLHKEGHEETLSFCLLAQAITAATPRPANGQVVHVTQDGELLFGGLVNSVAETALAQPNLAGLRWRVTARDWTYVADVTIVLSLEVTAGTDSLALAEMIRATYLDDRWGVLPNGPIAGGPTLPATSFSHVTVRAVFDWITAQTGYFWRINGDKLFAMHAPGSIVGPTFTAANARIINQFGWSKQAIDRYTRLWLAVTVTEALKLEAQPGDGVRMFYQLRWEVAEPPGAVIEVRSGTGTSYDVWSNAVLPIPPGTRWVYDVYAFTLVQLLGPPLAVGDELQYSYLRKLPGWVMAQDQEALTAGAHLIETVQTDTTITDEAYAEAEVTRRLKLQRRAPQQVVLQTAAVNVFPDMSCTVTVPERLVTGPFLVQTVDTRDVGRKLTESQALVTTVTLIEGGESAPTWLDFWRKTTAGGGGGTITGGGGGGGGIGPPGPAGATYLLGHLGGSRSRTRTGTGPVPEWVPVIIDRAKLSSSTLRVRSEQAVFSGGGTVTPKLMALIGSVWTEVGRADEAVTGSSSAFVYLEFDATAQAGSVAYRLELETSVPAGAVAAIGNVTGT